LLPEREVSIPFLLKTCGKHTWVSHPRQLDLTGMVPLRYILQRSFFH
jgi:hypothetical protein